MLKRGLAAILILAAACGGATADPCENISSANAPTGATTCRVRVHMSIRASGAETIDLSRDLTVLTNEFHRGDLPREAWFANLGTEVPQDIPVPAPAKLLVQTSFDIAPGTYDGAGTYTLRPQGAEVPGLPIASTVKSEARLIVTSISKERAGQFTYNRLVEPCTVRFESRLVGGSLRCPKLGLEDGEGVVNLTVGWRPATRAG